MGLCAEQLSERKIVRILTRTTAPNCFLKSSKSTYETFMLPSAKGPNPELPPPPRPQTASPLSKLKLLDQERRETRQRHYSLRTEVACINCIKHYADYQQFDREFFLDTQAGSPPHFRLTQLVP